MRKAKRFLCPDHQPFGLHPASILTNPLRFSAFLQILRTLADSTFTLSPPLHYGNAFTYDEIGRVLSMTPEAVRKRVTRSVEKFRALYEESTQMGR